MSKPPGSCAFCGGGQLTKEHIWPDWLRSHVPRLFAHTGHTVSRSGFNTAAGELVHRPTRGHLHRPGDPHSQRLRVVCKGCNTQWMSSLQNHAKRVLVPMISGQWPTMCDEDQTLLSAWCTMFTMVVEFADLPTLVSTAEERSFLRMNRQPPNNWVVWIGRLKGHRWSGTFNHFGLPDRWTISALSSRLPITEPELVTQTTAFGVGELFVFTLSTRDPEFRLSAEGFAERRGVQVIWPRSDVRRLSQPDRILDDFTADEISSAFVPIVLRSHVRRAWEI